MHTIFSSEEGFFPVGAQAWEPDHPNLQRIRLRSTYDASARCVLGPEGSVAHGMKGFPLTVEPLTCPLGFSVEAHPIQNVRESKDQVAEFILNLVSLITSP